MNGIYYREGIYVLIENVDENDFCIYREWSSGTFLFGGRVKIENDVLKVDGISIISITEHRYIQEQLRLSEIVSHLNAIEVNGVDAFLENYKKSMTFLYGELKELNQNSESLLPAIHEDSKIKSLLLELEKIRTLLFGVLAILFSLHTYMAAGLENEKVITVCQSITDSLS